MIKISQLLIKAELINGKDESEIIDILVQKIIKRFGISKEDIKDISILKSSIDARKKPEIFYSYTVLAGIKNENSILKRNKSNEVSKYEKVDFSIALPLKNIEKRPVVCGFGPAGIAAAFILAKYGYKPIIIERGGDVDNRTKAVKTFWQDNKLNTDNNVQFGEGGAGAFSDGKLNIGNKDKDGLQKKILSILVEFGAPKKILHMAKPHIGTDILTTIVKNIREYIKECGGEFLFNTTLTEIITEKKSVETKIKAIKIKKQDKSFEIIDTDTLILAIGHSARDTFRMLYDSNIIMEAKSFAIGYRVAHPSSVINFSQYGSGYEKKGLPTADYKLTYHTTRNRAVYSFCMCPGGFIVNASSENNRLAINGMSYSKRDGKYSNSAIVMGITADELESLLKTYTSDYSKEPPALYGIALQERIEHNAYRIGKGSIPVCSLGDFKGVRHDLDLNGIADDAFKGKIKIVSGFVEKNRILPKSLDDDFTETMQEFGKRIQGFDNDSTLVSAVESRTSSPVRIMRTQEGHSISCKGLYPIGEGAGYAGGIMSAAMDGAKIIKKIIS